MLTYLISGLYPFREQVYHYVELQKRKECESEKKETVHTNVGPARKKRGQLSSRLHSF